MERTRLTNPNLLTFTLTFTLTLALTLTLTLALTPTFHPAQESTWLTQFESVMVFESHTESVSRVQQIWKYVPQRLYEARSALGAAQRIAQRTFTWHIAHDAHRTAACCPTAAIPQRALLSLTQPSP